MSKKGKRLREFEKNNRKLSSSEANERRAKRQREKNERNASMLYEVSEETKSSIPRKKKTKITNMRKFVTSVIVVILIAFVGVSVFRIVKLTNQRNELQASNAELLKLKEDLTAEFDHINSTEYIEQQARKELKMIKENELLFIVDEEENEK